MEISFVTVLGLIVALSPFIVMLYSWGRLFKKADMPWQRLFVPGYNLYALFAINDCRLWLLILLAASVVTVILSTILRAFVVLYVLFCIAVYCIHCIKLTKAFGRGVGFGIGLIFLHPIFLCILALNDSEYVL